MRGTVNARTGAPAADTAAFTDTAVPTADGVRLAATLVRPHRPGPAPTVVIRTPYGRGALLPEATGWARAGFACLVVDVRGRFDSEGEFWPYLDEASDGAAVVEWVLDQPECDGRLLLAGASYGAHCALATALSGHPAVRGVLAAVPALGPGATAREPGGAARLACRVGWWSEHGGTRRPRTPPPWQDLLEAVPPTSIPGRVLGAEPPGWARLWDAPVRDPLWASLGGARPPLLAVGGTRDPFAAHTLDLARAWGGPARLLLGPWGHELDARAPGTALAGRRIGTAYLAWARAVLGPGVRGRRALIAVDAHGAWRRLDLAPRTWRHLRLSADPAAFTADPARPLRSRPLGPVGPEPADPPDARVLAWSPPLEAGELRGPVRLRLRAQADTPDADWLVRLELRAGPERIRLAHALVRRAHRPGRLQQVLIRTPPVGAVVPAGARLGVEIAGHHWPHHARNPHTGEDPVRATRLLTSRRTVQDIGLDLPWHPPRSRAVDPARIPEELT